MANSSPPIGTPKRAFIEMDDGSWVEGWVSRLEWTFEPARTYLQNTYGNPIAAVPRASETRINIEMYVSRTSADAPNIPELAAPVEAIAPVPPPAPPPPPPPAKKELPAHLARFGELEAGERNPT